jgi:hypothetical protein
MSNTLYMLKCPGWSYFARYTVILVTSRDFSHITWLSQSCFCILLATLSFVKTFVCRLFHSLNNFSFLNTWCFSRLSFFLKSRSLLSRKKRTTSMTWFFHRQTSAERWRWARWESFVEYFWIYRVQNRFRASYV